MKKLSQEQIAAYVYGIARETINNLYGSKETPEERRQIMEAEEVLHDECYDYVWNKLNRIADRMQEEVDAIIINIDENEERWQREEDEEANED